MTMPGEVEQELASPKTRMINATPSQANGQ